MPHDDLDELVNFDNPELKRRFQVFAGRLKGMKRVRIEGKRMTRSQRANAYYFAAVITPFMDFLNEQGVEKYDKDACHDFLKAKILPRRKVIDPRTGELLEEILAETRKMKVGDFYDYVERCRAYLLEMFGIVTLDPDERDFAEAGKKETVKS